MASGLEGALGVTGDGDGDAVFLVGIKVASHVRGEDCASERASEREGRAIVATSSNDVFTSPAAF